MFRTFQADQALQMEIVCNWDTLSALYGEDEMDGLAIYGGQEWDLELRLRGRSRRKECDSTLLPFRIQFRKGELREAGLEEFRNHKIVTPCLTDDSGLESLMEEYLIYQLYNILSDSSFRVVDGILTRSWPDGIKKGDEISMLILEPNNELFSRLGGEEIELPNFPSDSLDPYTYNLNALFQFMIGNFDWSQEFLRNVKLVRIGDKTITVPYDFDYCSIVNPPYRKAPIDLGITTSNDRVYLGKYFFHTLPQAEAVFLNHRQEITDLVLEFEPLKKSRRKQIVKYLDGFFDYLADPEHQLEYKFILN